MKRRPWSLTDLSAEDARVAEDCIARLIEAAPGSEDEQRAFAALRKLDELILSRYRGRFTE